MNWRRSATGNWVASNGMTRFVIESLACWKGPKQVRGYRLRINGSAVGGVTGEMFPSLAAAKKYAGEKESKIGQMKKAYNDFVKLGAELSRSGAHALLLLDANRAYNAFVKGL